MHHAHKQKYPITGGHRPVATPLDERDKNYVQVAERFNYSHLQPQMYTKERQERAKSAGSDHHQHTVDMITQWLKVNGPATWTTIATALNMTKNAVQHHMSRSPDGFVNVGIEQGTGSPKLWSVAKQNH